MNKKRLMSVATKVAIQMCCKLGGEPWNVAIPIKVRLGRLSHELRIVFNAYLFDKLHSHT